MFQIPKCWLNISIFLQMCIPQPYPERSNNHSKWWLSNTNINIQHTYIYSQNCLQHISHKLLAAYIQYKFICRRCNDESRKLYVVIYTTLSLFQWFIMVWMVIPTKSQHIYLWNEATFVFGTENEIGPKNCEGWMVGVWDGNCWDRSQHIWGLEWSSQQNPNRSNIGRCSTKLPLLSSCSLASCQLSIFSSHTVSIVEEGSVFGAGLLI